MKFYQYILTIYSSILVIYSFTDPAVLNPQLVKRFEYKLSFKGPHLAFKDGTVPFWSFGGSMFYLIIDRKSSINQLFQVLSLVMIKYVLRHPFEVKKVEKKISLLISLM